MKILLDDGLQRDVGTGIGNYARYLSEAFSTLPETTVTREAFAPEGGRKQARLAYLKYLASRAYRERLVGFDVVHYANYAMPKKLPQDILSAVTVHDLAAFSHPHTLPRAYAAYNRFMVRRAMKHADLIFTVSNAMREEICTRFPAAAPRVVTVYPGHYTRATTPETPPIYENEALMGLEKRKFFLFVGTLEKRKNLAELVRAYILLQRTFPAAKNYALVLAGRRGFGADEIVRLVLNAPDTADIRLPGYISDSDRAKLYGEAAAFVFPSLYEGFGSPQTEAMAAGLPLILSDIPTNREISGNYGHYYPVGDESALAALLTQAITGELQADCTVAQARLARFCWARAATEIREVYETFLRHKKH